MIERITNHVERGQDLLLDQFKGKPRIEAWQRSGLRQVQILEDVIYDVLLSRLLDYATGPRLETLGRIVGEPKRGREDPAYKIAIRTRIQINRSQGTTKNVLEVFALLTSSPTIFNEYQPAAMFFEMADVPEDDPVHLYRMLHETKAGGVKLSLIVPTAPPETRFLPRTYDAVDVPGNGCGDANATQASLTSGNAEPYALEDGMTLTFITSGGTYGGELATLTFRAADFADIGAATAAEIIAVFNRDVLKRGKASGTTDVTIKTHRSGVTATLEVTGGTANAILDFSTTEVTGTGDTTFGLLSDAVTVRDPSALPVPPRPAAPRIDYIEPNSGPDEGGTELTIHGSGFATSAEIDPVVRLHATSALPTNVDDIVVVSDSILTCTTRARDESQPRKLKLWITTPYGTGGRSAAFRYVAPVPLAITSMTPSTGSVVGGTEVVILGASLTGAVSVDLMLNGDAYPMASFEVDSDSQITAIIPGGGVQYAPYGLRVRSATEEANFRIDSPGNPAWTYRPNVVIVTSITPDHGGVMGGFLCTVKGSGFVDVGLTDIELIGTNPVAFDVIDDETATFVMPDAASEMVGLGPYMSIGPNGIGQMEIWFYGGVGEVHVATLLFQWVPLAIAMLSSDETPAEGGQEITVLGTSIDSVLGVFVDGDEVDFTIVDTGKLTFVAPPGTPGSVVVHLQGQPDANAPNTVEEVADVALVYTPSGGAVPAAPVACVPDDDVLAGGAAIVVEVVDSADVTAIVIDGIPIGGFTIDDGTHVSGTVPAGRNLGLKNVRALNAFGASAALVEGFEYT